MKIVQFINNLCQGGAEAIVKDYTLELQKRGHHVEVITLFPFENSNNEKILKENGIKIRSIYEEIYLLKSTCLPLRVIRKPFKISRVSKWLKNYIKEFKPDVIHIHLTLYQYFTKISNDIKNVKLFFTCHNEANYYFGENNKKDIEIVKYLINNNNLKVIALHERMQNELNKTFKTNTVECLYNPTNLSKFKHPEKTKEEMRTLLNIPQDAFVLGHNGRFVEQKNHKFLIKVFDQVKKINNKAFLLMIGNGELRENIVNELDSMGYKGSYLILQDRKDVPEILNAMDVFLFPSLFEGFGIAIVEAEAENLRCIASDKVPELALVGNNTFQLGIEDQDVTKWRDTVLDNSYNTINYGNIEKFDLNKIIDKLEEMYKK